MSAPKTLRPDLDNIEIELLEVNAAERSDWKVKVTKKISALVTIERIKIPEIAASVWIKPYQYDKLS